MSLLHIDTDSIEEYFVRKLKEKIPDRASKIINSIKRERGGSLRHRTYADRSIGLTAQWEITQQLFAFHVRRLGFKANEKTEEVSHEPAQPRLF
ncbi:MAG TPA: hypothetical protein DEA22_07375 [Blastocatellia bacterium]|nr:hypothetical protein [Blastocatellia bacterium]